MAKAKSTSKKPAAKQKRKPVASKRASKPAATRAISRPAVPESDGSKLTFNHAMIYARDVQRGVDFYSGMLGFKLIEDFSYDGQKVYARLKAPGGDCTIALHQLGPGASTVSDGVRLYFEIRELDEFCRKLQNKGVYLTQPPRPMPWGWRHAYLDDPDGHEISLYWAGANRMKKTVMKAANEAKGVPSAKRTRK
jgi:catechol 2,3-dioxygenase-like lactoylglutathione lyase family enzyme